MAVLCDGRGVVGVGREHAAEILLTARATEKLVVGGQQLDGAVRQCPHLDTRTGQRFSGDPLLDDAAVLLEGSQIDVDRKGLRLRLHVQDAVPDGGRLVRGARFRQVAQVDHRIACAGDALVELHDRLTERRPTCAHALHARHDVVDRVQVLGPDRTPDTELLEHPAAAGLAAEVLEPGIGAVHRDPQTQCDVPLERCGVVRDQVTALRVRDQRPDLPQKSRPRKQFRAQRDC